MLRWMIFCVVWFLKTRLITCDENSTGFQGGLSRSEGGLPATVVRLSVPEDHHVCLRCGVPDTPDVVWTHLDRSIPGPDPQEDQRLFSLQPDGKLCLLQLEDSDAGEYRCNEQLVAELQVLTGHDLLVAAGRTLLLPCRVSSRPKQRWIQRRGGGRRDPILTRFKDGSVKPERDDRRFGYEDDALRIQNLQPEDAGDYLCNGELQATVSVLTVPPGPTDVQKTSSTSPTSAVVQTDVVQTKSKEKKPEDALLVVVVVGLGVVIVLMAAVCVLLTSMKCKKNKKKKNRRAAAEQRQDDTELQPWTKPPQQTDCEESESPGPEEELIHYASLGRPDWKKRPGRGPADPDHSVIYSSVVTR
ncbi:uncharacterized protein LOC115427897 [Sphaeramia orbicularis]|uniref:uncharacterized protein LOC115427897 n=1 Tax=Sphaeramia orbicularis TaxID=375764 RepID=UPI00117C6FEC|nr:uncharacterized protein LOC115427897 [Sphaeramia orbicularis]